MKLEAIGIETSPENDVLMFNISPVATSYFFGSNPVAHSSPKIKGGNLEPRLSHGNIHEFHGFSIARFGIATRKKMPKGGNTGCDRFIEILFPSYFQVFPHVSTVLSVLGLPFCTPYDQSLDESQLRGL